MSSKQNKATKTWAQIIDDYINQLVVNWGFKIIK